MTRKTLVDLLVAEGASVEYGYNICGDTKCTCLSGVVFEIGDKFVTISNPAICFPLEDALLCDEPQSWFNDSVILTMTCNKCYFTVQLR